MQDNLDRIFYEIFSRDYSLIVRGIDMWHMRQVLYGHLLRYFFLSLGVYYRFAHFG